MVRGGQHYGATRVSIEILKLPIKGGTFGWLKELRRNLQSGLPVLPNTFDFFFRESTRRDVEKIYTYITKTLPLTLKINHSINIQLQNVNVQVTKTDTETKNTD